MLGPERAAEDVDALDAVLQRHDERAGSDERRKLADGRFGLIQLDGEEHDVDRPDRRRVVGGVDARRVDGAKRTLNADAAFANRREMGAAGDERDVAAGRSEAAAKIPADASRAENRDPHKRAILLPMAD